MSKYKSLSIFQNVTKADLILKPSPHLIVKNCLDQELYNELSETFPTDIEFEKIINGIFQSSFKNENIRLSLHAYLALKKNNEISKVWVDFINYHTSKEFIQEFVDLFGEHLYDYYPNLKEKFNNLDEINEKVRFNSNDTESGLNVDCQICVNTPSSKKSSVIKPHTDGGSEIYAGLLYFRQDDDFSNGGDLIVHTWENNKKKKYIYGSMVKKNLIKECNKIKYEKNTLVFFLNTIDFVHSVSPREPSTYSRRFVNILAYLPNDDLKENILYPKTYAWGKHKIKLLLRSFLIKVGLFKLIRKIF